MSSNRKRIWLMLLIVITLPVAFAIGGWEHISPYRSHTDLRFQLTGELIALSAAIAANFFLILVTPARNLFFSPRVRNTPMQNFYLVLDIEFTQLMLSWRDFFPNDRFQPSAGMRVLVGDVAVGAFLWFLLSAFPPKEKEETIARSLDQVEHTQ